MPPQLNLNNHGTALDFATQHLDRCERADDQRSYRCQSCCDGGTGYG
jgi:hypothetical protein